MKPAKSFNNIIIGQFALAGLPLKVFVSGRYLTITEPDDLEDPLIGFGMSSSGEMIQFQYPEVDHLSVSGNSITIDTYNKSMEPDEPETPEEPKEEKPKETEKKGPPGMSDHYMPKLKDLIEITKDELKASLQSAKADVNAGKAKIKAAKEKEMDLKSQPIDDGVKEDEYEDLVNEDYMRDLEELDQGDIVIELDSGREWTIKKLRWWLGSPQMTLVDNTPGKLQTMEFPQPGDKNHNFFKYFELKESVNEATGAKIDMKQVAALLKKAGYEFHIAKGNKITGIKTINIPAKRPKGPEYDWGYLAVHSDGEIWGSDNWSTKMSNAKDIIKQVKAFIDSQEKLHRKKESVNEQQLNEAAGITTLLAAALGAGILFKLGVMSDAQYAKTVDAAKDTAKEAGKAVKIAGKALVRELPIIGKKIKNKELSNWQKGEIAKYIKGDITDKDVVKVLETDPKLKIIIQKIVDGDKYAYKDFYQRIHSIRRTWASTKKLKDLRKKLATGKVDESVNERRRMKPLNEGIKDVFTKIFNPRKKAWDTDPGEDGWFDLIAREALNQLKKHHKWKDMELAAMGPGNSKNYMDMAITSKKKRGPEYEFKVHFDPKTDKVKKIEDVTPKWRTESVNEDHIDTISEPYMFKVGDVIHNDNPACTHYGSKGIVITTDPEEVRYTVTNNGNFFKPGDILQKTIDQLKLA